VIRSANKSQLKLRSEVRHQALENSLGGRGGRLRLCVGDRKEDGGTNGYRE
jgi:hypothetical protein